MSGPLFRVEKMVYGGWGIVRDGDRTILVSGVIPGEDVSIKIVSQDKKTLKAKPLEIASPSPYRQEPPCPLFGRCGGCMLQHISCPHQAELKRETLIETIQRIAGLETHVAEIVPSPFPFNYRCRIKLHARGGKLGFFAEEGRELVEIDYCRLAEDVINRRIADARELLKRDRPSTIELVREEEDRVVAVVRKGKRKKSYVFSEGEGWIFERDKEHAFRQVNPAMNLRLRETISETADEIAPGFALELYAGDGNLTEALAPSCNALLAGDSDAAACRLAIKRLEKFKNIEFTNQSAKDLVNECLEKKRRPDLVLLDPPRKGAKEILAGLVELAPSHIVYVSCDPPALARDLKDLGKTGYRAKVIRPLDMFPQTYHLEAVALLKKD